MAVGQPNSRKKDWANQSGSVGYNGCWFTNRAKNGDTIVA